MNAKHNAEKLIHNVFSVNDPVKLSWITYNLDTDQIVSQTWSTSHPLMALITSSAPPIYLVRVQELLPPKYYKIVSKEMTSFMPSTTGLVELDSYKLEQRVLNKYSQDGRVLSSSTVGSYNTLPNSWKRQIKDKPWINSIFAWSQKPSGSTVEYFQYLD